jgi:enoyl-[acyl-carrier protein] reductase I
MKLSLHNNKGLILGLANENSLAWGCAQALKKQGADLAVTYLNESAKPYVCPLAETLAASICMPLDVQNQRQWDDLFEQVQQKWGRLDFAIHSIAFAPKDDLQGRVVDCSKEGFLKAMDISCYSFIQLARLCEPLMKQGGSLLTMSYYGAQRVVDNYNIMGPVKSALEASMRTLAAELGERNIRVNAISSGPIKTRAASGLLGFDDFVHSAIDKAPLHQPITRDDIGAMAAFLVSESAQRITGQTLYVDAGYNIMA